MTDAEIQQAYRRRRREVEDAAYSHPEGHSTSVILKALARQLQQLDDANKADSHNTARARAGQAIRELCRRYGIKPVS
jgi:L-lactate utilization protein LutC